MQSKKPQKNDPNKKSKIPKNKSAKFVVQMLFSNSEVWLNLGKVVSKNPRKNEVKTANIKENE